jgi:phosphatidylglycerophosphatase A
MTRVAVWLATVGGLGYAPVAPGTFGSAAGIAIYWLTRNWSATEQLSLTVLISALGVWAASRAEVHFGKEDPGTVVIDEVAGQLLTLALVPWSITAALIGFLLFRVLDIIKPWPANRFEALHGGAGIMADDLMAGLYGMGVMHLLLRFAPGMF